MDSTWPEPGTFIEEDHPRLGCLSWFIAQGKEVYLFVFHHNNLYKYKHTVAQADTQFEDIKTGAIYLAEKDWFKEADLTERVLDEIINYKKTS